MGLVELALVKAMFCCVVRSKDTSWVRTRLIVGIVVKDIVVFRVGPKPPGLVRITIFYVSLSKFHIYSYLSIQYKSVLFLVVVINCLSPHK